MNTIKYQALLEAADCGNLTKVAEKLNYSQPAISHMIHSLEKEYGFPLLYRTTSGVCATPEAERIIPRLREIVFHENAIIEEVNKIKNIETGNIKLGTYSSAMMSFLPKIIRIFSDKYPNIEITVIEGNYQETDLFLKNRITDFAVVSQFDYPEYDFLPILQDELMAVIPKSHPLAEKNKIKPEELFRYPILSTEEDSDQDIREISRIHGIMPNIKMRGKQETSLLKLIACNLGVGIFPNLFLLNPDPDLAIRPLDSPYKSRTMGIAALDIANLSPACKEFINSIPNDFSHTWQY